MQEYRPAEFNIRRYWALVVKRRYIALSVALAVISAFTWGSLFWPKTYEASSTVLVEHSSNLYLGSAPGSAGGPESIDGKMNILSNALTSRNMVERIIRKLYRGSNIRQQEWLVNDLPKNLEVTTKFPRDRGTTGLFVIKYKGRDPKVVKDVVNALVGEYIEENIGSNRSEAIGNYEFLKSQMLDYKKKMEESEIAITDFKGKNPGMAAPDETAMAGKADTLDTARVEAEIRLNESLGKRGSLQRQLSAEKEGASVKEGTDARLLELNNQLVVLTARYTDDYPEVRKTNNEIEELKKQITREGSSKAHITGSEAMVLSPAYQQLRRQLADTDTEIATLKARVGGISKQQAGRGQLGQAPKAQEEWARLQRDRNAYQKIYDDFMQKLGSAGASKEFELTRKDGSFKVVDPAILPNVPVKPNTVLMIVLGIILGAMSGVGAAVWLDNLARSLKDEESIEATFHLPVLATIHTVTTEADTISARKADRTVFTAGGIYFLLVLLVLAAEFLYRYLNIKVI